MFSIPTVDGCEILRQLETIGILMKHCKFWDYDGINHLPTGAGFLPFTVFIDGQFGVYRIYGLSPIQNCIGLVRSISGLPGHGPLDMVPY